MANFNVEHYSEKWRVYGNNYFVLRTMVEGNEVKMDGIMQELPALSFSTEWELSPAATLGEKLGELANSEFLEFLAQKGGSNMGTHMVNADQMTSRTYKSGSKLSFDLKFRCYTGQKVGPYKVRTAKEWIRLLSLTTPVNSNCGVNINSAFKNIGAAADGAVNLFKALAGDDEANSSDDKKSIGDDTMSAEKQKAVEEMKRIKAGDEAAKKEASDRLWHATDTQSSEADQKKAKAALKSLETGMMNTNASPGLTNATKLDNPKLYGANIFMLRIYPFFFTKPFSVYIKSWTVTPSREWNNDTRDHYYYDFSIQCEMDQTPSSVTWVNLTN